MLIDIHDFINKLESEFKFRQKLQPESIFEEVYEINSLNTLLFISFIHEEFGISLNIGALRKITTVLDLYELIKKKDKGSL